MLKKGVSNHLFVSILNVMTHRAIYSTKFRKNTVGGAMAIQIFPTAYIATIAFFEEWVSKIVAF